MDEAKISREQAVQMAQQVCDDWGWPWQEPLVKCQKVISSWENWVVRFTLSRFVVPIHTVRIVISTRIGKVVAARHFHLLREIPFIAKITRKQAVGIARQVCEERDWPRRESGWRCGKRLGKWEVNLDLSSPLIRAWHKIIIIIDAKTGAVIEAKYICTPR